jgi:hypothetical protein
LVEAVVLLADLSVLHHLPHHLHHHLLLHHLLLLVII